MSIIWYLLIVCSFAFTATYINAQELQAPEDENFHSLPEVLVEAQSQEIDYVVQDASTATKSDSPIENIPQSIQVIDRDLIEDQRAESLQDIVYNVSSVVPGDSAIMPFLIRGFRADVLKDGYAFTTALALNIYFEELTNVQRVEFLKGPSSVLYGNTAAGGIINIITKKPLPYFYSYGQATIGSYNFYRGEADISTPLTKDKSLLFRLSASYRNSDSFRDFIYSDRVLISPVMSWQINSNIKLTVEGEYFYVDQPFDDGLVAVGESVANIPISRNLAEPTDHTTQKSYLGLVTLETKITEKIKLRNGFRYYITRANTFDHSSIALLEDNRTLLRFIFDSVLNNEIFTNQNELVMNLSTWDINHTLLFGVEYIYDNLKNPIRFLPATPIDIFDPVYNTKEMFNPDDFPVSTRAMETNNLGLYIQDRVSVYDKLFIVAGVRYDYLNQNLKDNRLSEDRTFIKFNEQENEFSPRIGALYEFINGVSVYANYSKSFNRYAIRAFTIDGSVLKPEKTVQYETGFKFYLFGGKLSSTAAIFRINKKNALTPNPIAPAFAVQVDEERSQGFELDLSAQPLEGLNLIASYALVDAKITKDDIFPSGNRLASVPKNSGSIWSTYRFHKGVLSGVGFGAGMIAVGEREGDLENTFKLDGFVRFDGAIYYTREIKQLGLLKASVNFKNITDETYIAVSDSRERIIPGSPFSVFGNLRIEF